MGRKKLSLQLIPKEKSRKLTYERRKKGLMKKAQELSALCGVDTCVIAYDSGSCGNGAVAQPEIWPSNHGEVRRIIERYQSGCPQTGAKKRSSGLHEFFENKKRKVESELEKVRKEAWDAKYEVPDELLRSLSGVDLRDFLSSLQRKLDAAKGRLSYMKMKAKGGNYPADSWVSLPVPSPSSFGYLPHMQMPWMVLNHGIRWD